MPVDIDVVTETHIGGFIKHLDFENRPTEQLITKNNEYIFDYDHDLVCLYRNRKSEFNDIFAKARESYAEGDWINASTALNMATQYFPNDGPCKWMLQFLEKSKLLPPDDWKGVRDIDKKLEPPNINEYIN